MSLNKFGDGHSEQKDYDILASELTLKDMRRKAHKKGGDRLFLNDELFCKGTKFTHTQLDGLQKLYKVLQRVRPKFLSRSRLIWG